jgi:hypothetical protein
MDQPLTREFGSLEPGRAWFNTAHQGPLPSAAVEASARAAALKANPWRLADSSFSEVPEVLRPQQAYWLAMQGDRGLDHMRDTRLRDDLGVRGFDVFCPAAFATSLPWIASLDLFLAAGVDSIARYDQELVSRLLAGVDSSVYSVVSSSGSTLVVLSRRDGTAPAWHRLLTSAGIDTAYREGNLRFSLHTFNTVEQVDRALDALHVRGH